MVDKETLYENLNDGILQERILSFKNNLRKNIPFILKYGGVGRIVESLTAKNVVIIGAGESLETALPALKKYKDRDDFIYIASDMSLKPLAEFGISPSYAISCETHPRDYFSGIESGSMHLLAFSCMSHANVKKWRGDMSFYNWMMDRPEYEGLWDEAGRELGSVATGNLVTTQAVALALGCGIHSLMLVGNDMGFRNRFYARNTVAEAERILKVSRFNTLDRVEHSLVRANRAYEIQRGNELYYTNHQFLAAKMWLEELFQKQTIPVYDCSFPGCSEKYTIKTGIDDYFGNFDRYKRKRKRRK